MTSFTTQNVISQDSIKREGDAQKMAKDINALSESILAIQKVSVVPQEVINVVGMSEPEGISMQGLTLDFDKGEIHVSGVANNRSTLVTFKQNLEKNDTIGSVIVPISNFEAETNLNFELSALYMPIAKTVQQPKQTKQAVPTDTLK